MKFENIAISPTDYYKFLNFVTNALYFQIWKS